MCPTRSKQQNLQRFLGVFDSKDRVLITIYADPDSMASAMALKRLLWRKVQSVTIAYPNKISRFDNLSMVKLLRIPLEKMQELEGQTFSKVAMVDGQPHHNEAFTDFNYDVIIDHHPITESVTAPFIDIRPQYGATATIMTEYLRTAKIRPSERMATALIYAIRTDTSNFESSSLEADEKAFRFLFPHANMNLMRKIEISDMGFDDLEYFQQAMNTRQILDGRIFSHVGRVHSPDVLVLIADFFMRCHEASWVVVSGVTKKTLVVIIRNDGIRKNAGNWAKKVFSRFGNAGGRRAKARAEIPLVNLGGHLKKGDDSDLGRFVIRQFTKGSRSR